MLPCNPASDVIVNHFFINDIVSDNSNKGPGIWIWTTMDGDRTAQYLDIEHEPTIYGQFPTRLFIAS